MPIVAETGRVRSLCVLHTMAFRQHTVYWRKPEDDPM